MPCSLCGQSGHHNIRTCMKHHPTKTHSTMTREEWKGLWKNREFIGIVGSIDMLPEGVIQMIGDFLPHKSVGRLSSVNRQLNQDLKEQCEQSKKHAQMWKKCGIKENDTIVEFWRIPFGKASWPPRGRIVGLLPALAALPELIELRLQENLIQEVAPLARLTSLTKVTLAHNEIQDVAPFASLSALTFLSLSNNRIQDVTPLASMKALTYLGLYKNKIQDVTPLASLTKLSILDLGNNRIVDISPLERLFSLTDLRVHNYPGTIGNQIQDQAMLSRLRKQIRVRYRATRDFLLVMNSIRILHTDIDVNEW